MQWAEKDDPKLRVHEWGGAHCCRNIEQYISPDCYQTIQLTTEGPSLLFGTAEHPENLFRIILGKPRWELIFFPKYEDAWSSISMDLKKILAMQKSYFSFHLSTQFTCTSHAHQKWTEEWSLSPFFLYGRMLLHLSFHWNQILSSTGRGTM